MLMLCLSLIEDESDQEIFERIYHRYADDIFKRVYHLLKNQQDTEDAMQNTWLAIAENIDFYRTKDGNAIKSYILRVAEYQAKALYRKNKKEKYIRSDTDLVNLSDQDSTEDILFQLCNQSEVSFICKCIASLPREYSDVMSFFYFHDHTIKEISKKLNLSETAVSTRLYRGRIKLLKMLEGGTKK